ncbi:MAG TPA: DUF417 family protein [Pyrinomonadaceae bacterium]|nr:DUF417 family protein [Pyrinomonadaceae bacterium]
MVTNVQHIEHTNTEGLGYTLENLGANIIRYGLAVILLWVGALKFTAYEAEGIQGLIANSPFMSWMYSVMSVQAASMLIGTVEIIAGLMIAARPFAPKISAIGSIMAIGIFLVTLHFLLTTPGVWQPGYGFPFPSPMPGQFIAKDLALLGIAVWSAGEALRATKRGEVAEYRT